jgi:predicted PurR-regulated permease PerM
MPANGNQGMSRPAAAFFLVCFLLTCFAMYVVFRPFFSILVWACVLTVVFQPLFRLCLRRFGNRRVLASAVSCGLILVLIVVPVTFLAILIGQQSIGLYHSVQASTGDMDAATAKIQQLQAQPSIKRVLDFLQKFFGPGAADLEGLIKGTVENISRFAVSYAPSLIVSVGDVIYRFFMTFITMFFLFIEGPIILQLIRDSNPLPAEYESEFLRIFEDVSFATFSGSILGALIVGVLFSVLFWLFGIGSPLFWGAMAAFVSLIPVIGSLLIIIPIPTYVILSGHTGKGILLLVLASIIEFAIENVAKPTIVGGRSNMHPLLIFFAVLGGMQVFGFLGILLGPLVVTVFLSFLGFFRQQFQGSPPAATQ